MSLSSYAGKKASYQLLDNIPLLMSDYYTLKPDVKNMLHLVSFGTSGHRGCSSSQSFNEEHIMAISQAIVEYRDEQGYTGPLYMGMDTHALSESAHATAMCVFVANSVETVIQSNGKYTPTPGISRAILSYNETHDNKADGVVITPSHNPPKDGGFKYNPPHGGPADSDVTTIIQNRANEILRNNCKDVKNVSLAEALESKNLHKKDLLKPYVDALDEVVDMQAIAESGLKIGVDPMGSAAVHYWNVIAKTYGLDITVVNPQVDPTFSFMHVDKDGKIRMDCSSPYAMAGLINLKDKFDIAFANDPDVDRHGIVTKSSGLMNPNHYLAVAIEYLFSHRTGWPVDAKIGKTLVSSSIIDRVGKSIGKTVYEVPVGFKWFVHGLISGEIGFGGEESAGASFLKKNGEAWSTDKDGIILNLLAAEITAVTGKDPSEHYKVLTEKFGSPCYMRIDAPASKAEKEKLSKLTSEKISSKIMAGDKITAKLTNAPGNGAAIGGLKVETANGWFTARPSGTEDIYKIYAESFISEEHLAKILDEAKVIVAGALAG